MNYLIEVTFICIDEAGYTSINTHTSNLQLFSLLRLIQESSQPHWAR